MKESKKNAAPPNRTSFIGVDNAGQWSHLQSDQDGQGQWSLALRVLQFVFETLSTLGKDDGLDALLPWQWKDTLPA
ncbi:hypothetical protein [Aidingimonas lacisalsi]|uniref:hypothetical protein n=1 Tax=Aidingimonas lacisalsi TaxID=2604086 RepID=UPI001F236EE2|nr:hypothetical protein [Aidingimonas lacisalsi]